MLSLAVVGIVVLWRCLPKQVIASTRAALLGSIAAIAIAAVFFVANAPFVSQWFDPTRDPALYLLGGVWLMHSPTAGIDVSATQALTAGIPNLTFLLGNFGPSVDHLVHLQGGDLLPAMIAIAGFVGGIRGALEVNLLLGAGGLLAVYGLARRVIGPVWALVPEVALGLSVAYMFFARGTYSEIIMLLVCAAGLTWLISGLRTNSVRDYVVAGIFLGTASMTRIDGPIAFVGVVVVLGVAGLGFLSTAKRRGALKGLLWFVLTVIAITVLGLLDLIVNKSGYLGDLISQARLLWIASLGVVVVAALCWVIGRRLDPERLRGFWRAVGWILSGGTAAVLLFWLSRPLWFVGRYGSAFQQPTVGVMQQQEGLAVDPARSYEEQTFAWVGWYFGWPMVALAIVGLVLLVFLGVKRRSVPLLITAVAPLAVAALYFTRVSITPDQVWAYRRLLPIVTPGLLIAAVFPLRLAWKATKKPLLRGLVFVLALLVAFGPVVTWNGLLLVRDRGNQYGEIQTLCSDLQREYPKATTALLVLDGEPPSYALTIKAVCKVDVVSIHIAEITDSNLVQLHGRTGDIPVVLFSPSALPHSWGKAFPGQPAEHVTVPSWNADITRLPASIESTSYSIWLGRLTSGGAIVPGTK